MIRRVARSIREYKWPAILSPLAMIGEVAMEVLIPLVMASLYDYGVVMQNMNIVVTRSAQLIICALMSLSFGVLSAIFASRAGTGFAKNLRHDMFYKVQKFSFSNIDKFSSASIVTRLTSDVANLQMTFQMMIRMAIRCPMMLVLAFISANRISPELSRIYLFVMPVLALALICLTPIVFQVAAHEELIPLEELYDACHKARSILRGKHGVGRVIARPFVGNAKDGFKRTANRHDYSLEPPKATMLDAIKAAGLSSIAVGKIHDIFAGYGDTEYVYNKSNANGMEHALNYAGQDFTGLCFVNLVDFDMQFGHRRDIPGYAKALTEFDNWLPSLMEKLGEEDILMITADHGCDPAYTATTDHTREYVPLLILGKAVKPVNLGTRKSFADIAATVTELLGVEFDTEGVSFAKEIL